MAEQAVDKLACCFSNLPPSRTASDSLPGGDFTSRSQLRQELALRYPWVPVEVIERWVCSYGTLVNNMLEGCDAISDLGRQFGHGLTQREVDYLLDREWARSADDILWRRTKLGLRFSEQEATMLGQYLAERLEQVTG